MTGYGVAVTGWSAHLPALPPGARLAGWEPGPACPPEDAATLLGRKGLLAKEPATRLALCAVHRALGRPARAGRRVPDTPPDPDTAVVVATNLGNCATVAAVASAVAADGVRAVSPLDAPNASSNVVSSTVAIWFGWGGPNLTVCSGHPAGLDAVRLGVLLLSAGRARRVVVVGAEPADPVAAGLLDAAAPLRPLAACVLLERDGDLRLGPVEELTGPPPGGADLLLAPAGLAADAVDLTGAVGAGYGALGVLQVAVAAAVLAERGGSARIVCGDPDDGYRTTRLSRGTG
ncbi:beta-ketoacyl synthase N-terminal-like domain-containing protein [Micromonospora echinaurantiaca]|uniref:beta-ketoacyl synthase N-terminal-like domain-containing protein n=1 Tax=Micromonospora echinaurantiaca TaxID=47857 RepID=UPI0037BA90A8